MANELEELIRSLIEKGYLKSPLLIQAFRTIERADFVLPEYRHEAYGNYPLPIGQGQTISQPLTVAFMLELLEPAAGETILDIGAGSGWQSALLAHLVREKGKVIAVERLQELCDLARRNIDKYGFIKNGIVMVYCQDATDDLPEGPYDKIIAAAAAPKEIPELWRAKLKVGGRIVAPVDGSIWLFIKKTETEWEEKEFVGFTFVPLVRGGSQKTEDAKPKYRNFSILKLFILLFFGIFAITSLSLFEIYLPHTSFRDTKKIDISSGLGSRKIAEILKREGAIRSKWAFVVYVSLLDEASRLKPGVYEFRGSSTIPSIAETLVRGEQGEYTIIVPEGWTALDIADYLEREGVAERNAFLALVSAEGGRTFQDQFPFLQEKSEETGLEGYLFPDTYRIFRNAKAEDILKKMLENFDRKIVQEFGAEARRQGKTLFDVLIVASLIEKEVVGDSDREIVSGILWKRLEANIPLQVDATITYLTRKKTTRISREEIQIDSLYNTYKYRGLPPGSIANPGLSAIRAAFFPTPSPYFYYLSASDGRTIFSKTLEEHNRAKAKYLK